MSLAEPLHTDSPPRARGPAMERFERLYIPEPNSGCWLWLGARTHTGHGGFWDGKKQSAAYRFAYLALIGPIPPKMDLHHKCHTPSCVNPNHLVPMTHGDHLRMEITGQKRKPRPTCRKGHPMLAGNARIKVNLRTGESQRVCRTCENTAQQERRRKAKSGA